ncbi:MAG TPA: VIT domain-containing protein [Thermoanaerobaculia bacterium]|jgi:hypothetical protein
MRFAAAAVLTLLCLRPAAAATLPSLTIEGDDGNVALALESVEVDVLIRGHLARTTFELTFRNHRDGDLDGRFSFPLPRGAEVSELGLYFDGKLRYAEAVEAAQARRAYEETVHRMIDPVLGEWSASTREFRFRVYPIPAHGTKVVHLAYDQDLTAEPYVLDLRYGAQVQRVEASIDHDGTRSRVHEQREIRIARGTSQPLIAFSPDDSMWYSSAPNRATRRLPPPSSHATVLYDVSASAARRDEQKLRAFLATFPTMTVIPFHIDVDAPVASPDGIAFGGATNLQAALERLPEIAAAAPSSRLVLVTDGLHTMGSSARLARAVAALAKMGRPVMVVNASGAADDHFLRRLARVTNGWYVDLSRGGDVEVAEDRTIEKRARQQIRGGRTLTSDKERDLVRRAWARARLRELLDSAAPAEQVLAHGLAFQQITPHTSLLVLDGWWQYEEHGIPVPPELRAQRAADLAEAKAAEETFERARRRPSTISLRQGVADPRSERLAAWFMTGTIVCADAPLPGATVTLATGRTTYQAVSDSVGAFRLVVPHEPRGATLTVELQGLKTAAKRFRRIPRGWHAEVDMALSADFETITLTAEAPAFPEPDGVYTDAPLGSFTIDKATVLKKALPTRDVRALTELAEAFADDGAVVRIVARVLVGWGRADLAAQLFERAKELGMPDEAPLEAASELAVDAMWDANYSDVDLHVLEPGGEEVSYSKTESSSGGRLHDDVTGGYGPELYTLPRIRGGEYQILLSYFADDETQVSRRTLAHVIVRVRGERRDYLLLLGGKNEKSLVATVP